jgi:hypothetical protein
MFGFWRGSHAVIPLDDFMSLSIIGKLKVILIGEPATLNLGLNHGISTRASNACPFLPKVSE